MQSLTKYFVHECVPLHSRPPTPLTIISDLAHVNIIHLPYYLFKKKQPTFLFAELSCLSKEATYDDKL